MALFSAKKDEVGFVASSNLINAWFVLDNSGSMEENGKWSVAKNGVLNCVSQLQNSDALGILVFSERIRLLLSGIKSNVNLDPLIQAKADGGGTALYDAIIESSKLAVSMHLELKNITRNVITYLIVLTDGEDTSSLKSVLDVKEILQATNIARDFKVVLAGVGLDPKSANIMKEIGSCGDEDIKFRHLKSNADISNLFEHVTLSIRQTRTEMITDGKDNVLIVQRHVDVSLNDGKISTGPAAAVAIAGRSVPSQPSSIPLEAKTVRKPQTSSYPSEAKTARKPPSSSVGIDSRASARHPVETINVGPLPLTSNPPPPSYSADPSPSKAYTPPTAPAPIGKVNPSMHRTVLTQKDPQWVLPSTRSNCNICRKSFGMITWRHNCRLCGEVICNGCCAETNIGDGVTAQACASCRKRF